MGAAEWRPPRRLLLAFEAVWADVHRALRRGLYVDRMTFLLLAALAFSLLLLLVCMPLICCCRRRRSRSEHSRQTTEPVKRRFPLTVARFEEFDALSPLIASPSNNPPSFRHKRIENEATRATRELFLRQHIRRADESPPPPRRFNGRTQIVPLTGSANRLSRPLVVPLLGTPESRITSFEAGTTKSCATIPEEADEYEEEEETLQAPGRRIYDEPPTDDLISIDRTYVSTRDVHNWTVPKIRPVLPAYAPSPVNAPEFRIAPPTYSPPAPPRVDSHHSTPVRRPNHARQEMTVQSNLSSPEMSSCGFGSMMETTGSVSESFLIPMDVDEPAERGRPGDPNRVYFNADGEKVVLTELDESSGDSSQLKSFPLQRIEEESEHFDDPSCISRFLGSSSGSGLSKYNNSNLLNNNAAANGTNHRIPRSISQQLELMNSANAH